MYVNDIGHQWYKKSARFVVQYLLPIDIVGHSICSKIARISEKYWW